MTRRLKSLERMASVQAQMVRLAEWRLATAERVCHDLNDDKTRLRAYVADEGSLGVPLAKAALRSLDMLDKRLEAAEILRSESLATLDAATRRRRAIDEFTGRVRATVRRAEEDRDLAATVDAWLATHDISLR